MDAAPPRRLPARPQAYEGLQTADRLRQEYLFIPAKVKEVYLVHLLGLLEELKCRSAIIFVGTCKVGACVLVHVWVWMGVGGLCLCRRWRWPPAPPDGMPPPQGCHLLALLLEELGVAAAALHSHKPQRARLAALDAFKGGAVPVLLATDVASRGLDIPTVDLVVNYDLPMLARDYVHRCAGC